MDCSDSVTEGISMAQFVRIFIKRKMSGFLNVCFMLYHVMSCFMNLSILRDSAWVTNYEFKEYKKKPQQN